MRLAGDAVIPISEKPRFDDREGGWNIYSGESDQHPTGSCAEAKLYQEKNRERLKKVV